MGRVSLERLHQEQGPWRGCSGKGVPKRRGEQGSGVGAVRAQARPQDVRGQAAGGGGLSPKAARFLWILFGQNFLCWVGAPGGVRWDEPE